MSTTIERSLPLRCKQSLMHICALLLAWVQTDLARTIAENRDAIELNQYKVNMPGLTWVFYYCYS